MITTHTLTKGKKLSLFNQYFTLIYMIYKLGNGMMIRSQIKQLYSLITNQNQIDIDFEISELINYHFLLQKRICKESKTEMLYLNKYVVGKLIQKISRDVPAIAFSNQMIFENVFKTEYLINTVIPEMQKQNFKIDTENILIYLNWTGSNLLIRPNQLHTYEYCKIFESVATQYHNLTDEFYNDMKISSCEKQLFRQKQLKSTFNELPYLKEKLTRDSIRNSYSETERNKQFYNFSNLMGHRFYVTGISKDEISIIYFDTLNNLKIDKLYKNLIYAMLMIQRYLGTNINLNVTVYTWNGSRCQELEKVEQRKVFNINTQEFRDTNRRDTYFLNLGIRKQYWELISVTYETLELSKYNIHC